MLRKMLSKTSRQMWNAQGKGRVMDEPARPPFEHIDAQTTCDVNRPRALSTATSERFGAPNEQKMSLNCSNLLRTPPSNSCHLRTTISKSSSPGTPTESQLVGAATSHQNPMSSRLARRNSGRQMPLWKNNARKLLQRSAAALGAQITRTIRSIGSVNGHDSSCDDLHACPLLTTQMV